MERRRHKTLAAVLAGVVLVMTAPAPAQDDGEPTRRRGSTSRDSRPALDPPALPAPAMPTAPATPRAAAPPPPPPPPTEATPSPPPAIAKPLPGPPTLPPPAIAQPSQEPPPVSKPMVPPPPPPPPAVAKPLPGPPTLPPPPDVPPAPPAIAKPAPPQPPAPAVVEKKKVPPAVTPPAETETARLLREGHAFLAAKQLTTPKDRSALGRFRRVLAIDPGNAEAKKGIAKVAATYKKWGSAALKRKEYTKAERYLESSVKVNDRDGAAYAFLGYTRLDLKKFQPALAAFQRALELNPDTPDYHSGMGITRFRMKDYSGAIKAFEEVAARRPDYAGARRLMGMAHEFQGNWREAASAYGRAYQLDPDHGTDALAAGRMHIELKEYGKALAYLQKAEKQRPRDPEVFDKLATAFHFLHRIPEALAAVETRERLEKEIAAGGDRKSAPPTTAPPPASTFTAAKPKATKPKAAKPVLTGVAAARSHYDAGRHATAYFMYKDEAKKGNAEAAYMLGRMHHQGIAVRRDLRQAFDWYMKAVREGHPGAQAGVGYMYYRGQGGVRRNPAVAAQWFEKAAKAGVTGAMARLGHMYEKGEGVARNSRTAAKWYVLAANKGNRAARKRMRELGSKPNSTIFKAPDEIDSGLGEMPALSAPSAPVAAAKPVAKPKPKKKARKCGGGLLGGLSCAGQ